MMQNPLPTAGMAFFSSIPCSRETHSSLAALDIVTQAQSLGAVIRDQAYIVRRLYTALRPLPAPTDSIADSWLDLSIAILKRKDARNKREELR